MPTVDTVAPCRNFPRMAASFGRNCTISVFDQKGNGLKNMRGKWTQKLFGCVHKPGDESGKKQCCVSIEALVVPDLLRRSTGEDFSMGLRRDRKVYWFSEKMNLVRVSECWYTINVYINICNICLCMDARTRIG